MLVIPLKGFKCDFVTSYGHQSQKVHSGSFKGTIWGTEVPLRGKRILSQARKTDTSRGPFQNFQQATRSFSNESVAKRARQQTAKPLK